MNMFGKNPYKPPESTASPFDDPGDIPYDQEAEFFSESERRFRVIQYMLARAREEKLFDELNHLGDKLNEDEEKYLPELSKFEDRIVFHLRKRFSKTDFFNQEFENDQIRNIIRRFEMQYLISQIDYEGTEAPSEVDWAVNSANAFLSGASRDYYKAVESADASLTQAEDSLISEIEIADEE